MTSHENKEFQYCVHVEIIPANMGARQVQEGFFYV